MIDLESAIDLVERTAVALPPRRLALVSARGRRLAAAVVADCDSPPFDRAMMDGFAVAAGDFTVGRSEIVELEVTTDIAAGDVTTATVRPGTCMRIMTGAAVPPGSDAIVPVESAVDGTGSVHAGGRVRLRDERFRAGQHVGRRGTAFRRGQEVLAAGAVLTPAAIGIAAEVGATHVLVQPQVRVAILATGSELVACDAVPTFGQTRNSNAPMLAAACAALGAEPIELGIAPDRPEPLRAAVAQGLASDVLVLTGGVSAGDLDLVPATFAACGVRQVFHTVRLKPGKPVWFGVLRRPNAQPTLVFGLPGNPASSLVCFELFVRPAIRMLAGAAREGRHLPRATARLVATAKSPPDRPVFLPCRVIRAGADLEAEPLPWTGSSDMLALATADGLIALPASGRLHEPGERVEVLFFDRGEP